MSELVMEMDRFRVCCKTLGGQGKELWWRFRCTVICQNVSVELDWLC